LIPNPLCPQGAAGFFLFESRMDWVAVPVWARADRNGQLMKTRPFRICSTLVRSDQIDIGEHPVEQNVAILDAGQDIHAEQGGIESTAGGVAERKIIHVQNGGRPA